MFNLSYAQSLTTTIALLIAYIISTTISGPIQALMSQWMGDSTATDEGYVSLNPLKHIDPLGTVLLLLTGFGFGSTMPIDPQQIKPNWRGLRFLIAYGAKTYISLVLGIVALVLVLVIYGSDSFQNAFYLFFTNSKVLQDLTYLYPEHSSLAIVCSILLMAFVFVNTSLAMWSALNNSIRVALVIGCEKNYTYTKYAHYFYFLVPLLVIFVFRGYLYIFFLNIIITIAKILANISGAL